MTNERFENPEEDRIEDLPTEQVSPADADEVKGGFGGISRLIAVSSAKADEANQAALQAATKQ
jgi:hypothetical protein